MVGGVMNEGQKVLLVGFTKPTKSRMENSELPDEVICWSSTDIPEEISTEFKAQLHGVYFHAYLGGREQAQIVRLFGGRLAIRIRDIAHLEKEVGRYSLVLAGAICNVLCPADEYRIRDQKIFNMIGIKLPQGDRYSYRPR